MVKAYEGDVAYLQDVYFGEFGREAAPGVLEILRKSGIDDGLVVDLGCGSGIFAKELVDAGYAVDGVDISRDLIALAKKRVPEASFRVGSFLKVKLPACDAVTSLGESFNYLFDADNTPRRLRALFRRVYQALRSGGVFIFDVAEPGRGNGRRRAQKHWEATDWVLLLDVDEDRRRRELRRRLVVFRRVGQLYRRSQEIHRLRLLRGTELAGELRRLGFRVRLLRGYGEIRFAPGHMGLWARKP